MNTYSQRLAHYKRIGYSDEEARAKAEVADLIGGDDDDAGTGWGIRAGRGWGGWGGKALSGDVFSTFSTIQPGHFKTGVSGLYRDSAEQILTSLGESEKGVAEIAAGDLLAAGSTGEWKTGKYQKEVRDEARKLAEGLNVHPDKYIRDKAELAKTSVIHAASLARHITNAARSAVSERKAGEEQQTPEERLSDHVRGDAQGGDGALDAVANEVAKLMAEERGKEDLSDLFGDGPGRGEGGEFGPGIGDADSGEGVELTEAEAEREAALFTVLQTNGGLEIRLLGELIPHFAGRAGDLGKVGELGVPTGNTLTKKVTDLYPEQLLRVLDGDIAAFRDLANVGLPGYERTDYTPQKDGDFTILVDVSGSMRRIVWAARLVTTAVAAAAITDGRKVHIMPFRGSIVRDCCMVVDPTKPLNPLLLLAEVSANLSRKLGGGTSLNESIRVGKARGYEGLSDNDDLLIITDGEDEHYTPGSGHDPTFSHPGKITFCHLMPWHRQGFDDPGHGNHEQAREWGRQDTARSFYVEPPHDTDEALIAAMQQEEFAAEIGAYTAEPMYYLVQAWREKRERDGLPPIGYFQADPQLPGEQFVAAIVKAADKALDVNDY